MTTPDEFARGFAAGVDRGAERLRVLVEEIRSSFDRALGARSWTDPAPSTPEEVVEDWGTKSWDLAKETGRPPEPEPDSAPDTRGRALAAFTAWSRGPHLDLNATAVLGLGDNKEPELVYDGSALCLAAWLRPGEYAGLDDGESGTVWDRDGNSAAIRPGQTLYRDGSYIGIRRSEPVDGPVDGPLLHPVYDRLADTASEPRRPDANLVRVSSYAKAPDGRRILVSWDLYATGEILSAAYPRIAAADGDAPEVPTGPDADLVAISTAVTDGGRRVCEIGVRDGDRIRYVVLGPDVPALYTDRPEVIRPSHDTPDTPDTPTSTNDWQYRCPGESRGDQIGRLADAILELDVGEPSESAGAVDVAIRLLRYAYGTKGVYLVDDGAAELGRDEADEFQAAHERTHANRPWRG